MAYRTHNFTCSVNFLPLTSIFYMLLKCEEMEQLQVNSPFFFFKDKKFAVRKSDPPPADYVPVYYHFVVKEKDTVTCDRWSIGGRRSGVFMIQILCSFTNAVMRATIGHLTCSTVKHCVQ